MSVRMPLGAIALAALAACDGDVASRDVAVPTRRPDASAAAGPVDGFVCSPAADGEEALVMFVGTRFDPAAGCLAGAPVSLPVCGCFGTDGHDTSTWCFAAPDGTAYFSTSADDCSVEMPAGWYATQTAGPAPDVAPTGAQAAACAAVASASTVKATYDRLGPPTCATPGDASADVSAVASSDASACVVPAAADTFGDAATGGCRALPLGDLCAAGLYGVECLSAGSPGADPPATIPSPAASLACTIVPVPTPSNVLHYCCACGG